jgi:mannitol/fructose-specific phosphotransferase system IIA component (Ntr-type)
LYAVLKGERTVKVLVIKFKSMLPTKTKEEITKKIADSLENNGFIVLDEACDYEIVEFEGGIDYGKE